MKLPHQLSYRRKAFTLIEILVVLAIIGVLAAILFPVLGSAREAARTATCSSNLKQIYTGMRLYLNDSNDIYPIDASYITSGCGWANLIYPYVKSTVVFECPNDETNRFEAGCPTDLTAEERIVRNGSYDYNLLRSGEQQWISEAKVGRPSDVMLFIDGVGSIFTPYGSGACSSPSYGLLNSHDCNVRDVIDRAETERGHRDGFNFCFADGHVKWIDSANMKKRSLWLNSRDAEYLSSPPPVVP